MTDVPVKEIKKCMKRPETKVFNKRGLHRKRVEQMYCGSGNCRRSGTVRTREQSDTVRAIGAILQSIER